MNEYLEDVRRYDAAADAAVVGNIVKYLGIALRNPDSALVGCAQKTERDRIRAKFLEKKLRIEEEDEVLDGLIEAVCERMNGDRMKNRVTFYYLLAQQADKLSLFGG